MVGSKCSSSCSRENSSVYAGVLNPAPLSSTIAITPVKTANASALSPVVRGGGQTHRGLWEALTLASRHDEMRLLDQVVRLGRQSALERVISLMLELHSRLRIVELADESGFEMPLTQEDLASALGSAS